MVSRVAAPVVALLALAVLAPVVRAQETPRYGGELVFVVPAESPSFDAHREESFALLHPAAPHYNTLLRVERRRHIREFEKRLLDEEVRYMFTFQWHRIVPHNARVRGWTITPSHFLNNQLDTVWLAE
jgi:hypothetical protein